MSRSMSAFLDRPADALINGAETGHDSETQSASTEVMQHIDEDATATASPSRPSCSSSADVLCSATPPRSASAAVDSTPIITLTTPTNHVSSTLWTSIRQRVISSFPTSSGAKSVSVAPLATTQSSLSTRLSSPSSSTVEVLPPSSILTARSGNNNLEVPLSTASNATSTTPTHIGAKPSNSIRQLDIASFTTPPVANRLSAADSCTPTGAKQNCASTRITPRCARIVNVLSPASQTKLSSKTFAQRRSVSTLSTRRSMSTAELLSPASHASPSTVELLVPTSHAGPSTVELLSPASHASPSSVTSAQQNGASTPITPHSVSTVGLLSPASQASPSSVIASSLLAIGPNDIATALLHPGGPALLPDNKKLHLLQQTVKPSGHPDKWPGSKRPSGQIRRITPFCYDEYGVWVTYSEHFGGLLCKYCVFFETAKGQTGQLVTQPCKKFDRLTGEGGYLHHHHFSAEYHQENVRKAKNFIASCENRTKPITDQLDSALAATKKTNRRIVTSIAEVVVLCARMGSAFRGHRDDGAVLPPDTINEIVTKQGNFRALVQLYSMANDHLRDHLSTCSLNASYVSKTIQNELIQCMGLAIASSIAAEVHEAKFYTILADETTDAARESQLSLSLRYIKSGNIVERFVGFVNPESLTGEGLANEIVTILKKLGLELTDVIGQGYDGAAAMSSEAKGVHGVMKTHCGNQAVYVHCAAHALNLTLMKASEVSQIRNAFGVVCSVANFFNSSTVRSGRLQKALDDTETTHSKRSLKAPCQTRWVEKHEAVHTLYDLFEPVATVLDELSIERGTASRDASALLNSMSHTEFVVSLCILNEVMSVTKQLSITLQSASTSLIEALSYKDKVKVQLDNWRKDDSKFLGIVAKAKKLLKTDELSVPRVVGRQTKRSNVPHKGPTDYYRKNLYFPFMDCLLSQFEDRFKSHDKVVKPLSSLLPKSVQKAKISDFHDSIELYEHLLPGNNTTFEIEFESWQIHCQEENSTTNDCLTALDMCPKAFYPNINALLSIYATLPVSTATPERTFSALKQIKTYLRSTMSEERLNGLALAYIHKELDILRVVTEMVDNFASENRRLQM